MLLNKMVNWRHWRAPILEIIKLRSSLQEIWGFLNREIDGFFPQVNKRILHLYSLWNAPQTLPTFRAFSNWRWSTVQCVSRVEDKNCCYGTTSGREIWASQSQRSAGNCEMGWTSEVLDVSSKNRILVRSVSCTVSRTTWIIVQRNKKIARSALLDLFSQLHE